MGKRAKQPRGGRVVTGRLLDLPEGEAPAPPVTRQKSAAREEEDFVLTLMYCLTAPLILYPGWEDTYANKRDEATIFRLALAAEIHETRMATEFEAMLYISSATLVAPPSHTWATIYFWLFRRWNREKADAISIEDRPLDRNAQEDLERLRSWMYDHQMQHLKAKLRGEGPREEEAPELVQAKFF